MKQYKLVTWCNTITAGYNQYAMTVETDVIQALEEFQSMVGTYVPICVVDITEEKAQRIDGELKGM